MEVEESFLRQKSRIEWLKEGDQNTGYFHRVVKGKTFKSRIQTLVCSDGTLANNAAAVTNEIIGYYKGQLGSAGVGANLSCL